MKEAVGFYFLLVLVWAIIIASLYSAPIVWIVLFCAWVYGTSDVGERLEYCRKYWFEPTYAGSPPPVTKFLTRWEVSSWRKIISTSFPCFLEWLIAPVSVAICFACFSLMFVGIAFGEGYKYIVSLIDRKPHDG